MITQIGLILVLNFLGSKSMQSNRSHVEKSMQFKMSARYRPSVISLGPIHKGDVLHADLEAFFDLTFLCQYELHTKE